MMESSPLNGIFKKAEKMFRRNKKDLISDEIVCACYLHRSMEYNDKKSYRRFKELFDKLEDEKKFQVINYYLAYSKNKNKEAKAKKKMMRRLV